MLGLAGQMAKLDSYYLEEGGPAAESAGYWHARCLADTAHAAAWYMARLRNFVVVRAYEVVAEPEGWTVVRHSRRANVVALARTGLLLDLADLRGPGRRLPARRAFSVRIDDYNLELDDTATIDAMQRALRDEGVFKCSSCRRCSTPCRSATACSTRRSSPTGCSASRDRGRGRGVVVGLRSAGPRRLRSERSPALRPPRWGPG